MENDTQISRGRAARIPHDPTFQAPIAERRLAEAGIPDDSGTESVDADEPAGAFEASTLALWRRCAQGAQDADWHELHQRLAGRIRAWLQRGIGRYGQAPMLDADDLAQEVYCRLLANGRQVLRRCRAESEGELMAYVARICRSVLVSAARELGARKRRSAGGACWPYPDHDEMASRGLSPEERAVVSDVRRKATACTTRVCPVLARRQRFILEQVLFVGYTSSELSPSIGLSASAIDSVVSRARRRAHTLGIPFPPRTYGSGDRCRSAGRGRAARAWALRSECGQEGGTEPVSHPLR